MTNEETTTTATVAERGVHGAPKKPSSKKGATQKKGAPKGQNTAKGGKKAANPARAKETAVPRAESKGAKILALIRRPKGATLSELAKLTGWQNHSIRGYLSGTVGKKMGLTVESTKRQDGERVYSITK
jgi:Protein of unknown function (DUF3489)